MPRRMPMLLAVVALLGAAVPAPALAAGPAISGFAPARGPIGTLVTIGCTGLAGATSVRFGGTAGAIVSNTGTSIRARVPAGASTGRIRVKTPGGSTATSASFTVGLGILLGDSHVPPGGTVLVSGSGYTPQGVVDLYLDARHLAVVIAGPRGAIVDAGLKVPVDSLPGGHWVSAVDRATSAGAQKAVTVFTDWPMFRAGPRHRGRNDLETILSPRNVTGLVRAWRSEAAGDYIASSPAVAAGVVYAGSGDGRLYAWDAAGCGAAAACAPLWRSEATGGHISSPAVAAGVVYAGSADRRLYAWDAAGCGAAACAPLWRSEATDGYIHSSPAVAAGVVYAGSDDRRLYAWDAAGCGAAACAPL